MGVRQAEISQSHPSPKRSASSWIPRHAGLCLTVSHVQLFTQVNHAFLHLINEQVFRTWYLIPFTISQHKSFPGGSGASLVAQLVHRVSKSQTQLSDFHFHFYSDKESACQCRRPWFNPWVGKILWRKNGNPLQYSCLGNPMDSGTWCALAHGAAESQATLNDKGQKTKHKFTLAPASPCLWCACLSVCRGVCVM